MRFSRSRCSAASFSARCFEIAQLRRGFLAAHAVQKGLGFLQAFGGAARVGLGLSGLICCWPDRCLHLSALLRRSFLRRSALHLALCSALLPFSLGGFLSFAHRFFGLRYTLESLLQALIVGAVALAEAALHLLLLRAAVLLVGRLVGLLFAGLRALLRIALSTLLRLILGLLAALA